VNPLRWRKMTWLILIFTGIMIVWAYAGTRGEECSQYAVGTSDRDFCDAGETIGTGIGVSLLFCIWFIGFIILSVIWFMSRGGANRSQRLCPVCGSQTKPGQTVCKKCGYDYAAAAAATASKPPTPVIETTGTIATTPMAVTASSLKRVCPTCGDADIPESGRFCPSCGTAL
jgi:hypothetical protein